MDISFTGKLLHIFEKPAGKDTPQRFGFQLLSEIEQGDMTEQHELRNFNLPKGTNPNAYMKDIGKTVILKLKEWSQNGRHGYYVEDVRDIKVMQEKPAMVKQA